MKNYLLNKPLFAVFLVSIVIAIQFAISREYPVLNLPRFLSEKSDPADLISLTVALSTVSAIIAGFAGVVIVLGLSSKMRNFALLDCLQETTWRVTGHQLLEILFCLHFLVSAVLFLFLSETRSSVCGF